MQYDFSDSVNKRIAKYRNLAGYTQETAATALGIKKSTYARMERTGNPKTELLKQLADLYRVPLDMIVYGERRIGFEPIVPHPAILRDTQEIAIKTEPPLTFSVTEKNCIKMLRRLDRDHRAELLKMINEYVSKNS